MTPIYIDLFYEDTSRSLQITVPSYGIKMYKLYKDDEYSDFAQDLQQRALYMLFGPKMRTGGRKIYIGQTGNALRRMRDHKLWKGFWQFACVFVRIESQYTPTDTLYLEYFCIKAAMEYGQSAMVENCQIPKKPACRPEEQDELDTQFLRIKSILELIGINPFGQKLCDVGSLDKHTARTVAKRVASEYASEYARMRDAYDEQYETFGCDGDEEPEIHRLYEDGKYDAVAMTLANGQIYVFGQGCIAKPNGGERDLAIENAINDGVIDKTTYSFLKDKLFDTSEQAQMFITGDLSEGRWRPPFK